MQNNYSPFYQRQSAYIPNQEYFKLSSQQISNINPNSNTNISNIMNHIPNEPLIIPVTRHNRYHFNYISRTPSPPPKRNIIDINQNNNYIQTSYSPIVCHRIDTNNDVSSLNSTIKSEKNNSLYQKSNNYIFTYNNVLRELPKINNGNINNINLGKRRQSYSYYVNNNLFDSLEAQKYEKNKLNQTNKSNQIFSYYNNSQLKPNNMEIRNINMSRNQNDKNKIKNFFFFHRNNSSDNLNSINSINNINNRNNNNQNNNISHYRHLSLDVINNTNNNYYNYLDISNRMNHNNYNILYTDNNNRVNHNNYNISITDNNDNNNKVNQNYQNSIEISKNNNNSQNNRININKINNNNINISRNHKNGVLINIPKKQTNLNRNLFFLNCNKTSNVQTNIQQNHINLIPVPKNKHFFNLGENGITKKVQKEKESMDIVPGDDFNPQEFNILEQIGKGGYGKIYSVRWSKNNKLYAMKKINIINDDELLIYRNKVKIMQNLVRKTKHNGFVKIYGDKYIPQIDINDYNYFIIMELGERDWLAELKMREVCQLYYTEYELFDIALQLIKSLAIMQNHNITHRDIKPHNILLFKGVFKLCDYGEVKIISGDRPILLPIGGSELYMSPLLYYAVKNKKENVMHNTYKSDVFSLGMCLLLAAGFSRKLLLDIRKLKDMNSIYRIIHKALISKYSQKFINLIVKMLQIDENLRFDFNELHRYITNISHY